MTLPRQTTLEPLVRTVQEGALTDAEITHTVHPELRDAVPTVQALAREMRGADLASLAAARNAQVIPAPLPAPAWTEEKITGPEGTDLTVFVVNRPEDRARRRPAILHIHGGGFVWGCAVAALPLLQDLASTLDCVVLSVDYRLAPETAHPGSLEDNYAALKWLFHHAAELGVDPARIALLGESAGGGHAAMLALAARDRGEVPIAFQALVYPMLDDRTASTRPVPPHIGTLLWTPALNRFGWSCLLGLPAGSDTVPEGAVPARARDLRGLPPTFISVGTIDLFVDECLEYARRLTAAGVPTELHLVPGAFHAFDVFAPDTPLTRTFQATLKQALASALRSTQAPAGLKPVPMMNPPAVETGHA